MGRKARKFRGKTASGTKAASDRRRRASPAQKTTTPDRIRPNLDDQNSQDNQRNHRNHRNTLDAVAGGRGRARGRGAGALLGRGKLVDEAEFGAQFAQQRLQRVVRREGRRTTTLVGSHDGKGKRRGGEKEEETDDIIPHPPDRSLILSSIITTNNRSKTLA